MGDKVKHNSKNSPVNNPFEKGAFSSNSAVRAAQQPQEDWQQFKIKYPLNLKNLSSGI